ncbi:MAG: hypothetical protein KH452_01675 [Clostridiales bacterium]|nr:hypothetical protein [Clostridiales bacterium]
MKTRLVRNEFGIDVKTGRIDQACARYGVGRNTMRQIAEQAGAVVRIGRNYLINFQKVDAYLDFLSEE